MSEKRFIVETVAVRDKVITDTEKCYSYEDLDEIVDKLNEQQATIKQLQEELELTANTKLWSRRKLEEENEQLRKDCTILVQSNQEYRKENEQLRQRELYLESVLEANEILYYDGVADE